MEELICLTIFTTLLRNHLLKLKCVWLVEELVCLIMFTTLLLKHVPPPNKNVLLSVSVVKTRFFEEARVIDCYILCIYIYMVDYIYIWSIFFVKEDIPTPNNDLCPKYEICFWPTLFFRELFVLVADPVVILFLHMRPECGGKRKRNESGSDSESEWVREREWESEWVRERVRERIVP